MVRDPCDALERAYRREHGKLKNTRGSNDDSGIATYGFYVNYRFSDD